MLLCDGQSVSDEMKLLLSNESPEFCPLELRELCEEMVRKCTGLPHAIVVLGGLLSRNKLPTEWAKMLNYIGLFPKDQAVSTRKLLLLWIAEGFVIQQDQQRMEDVAEDYLNELINRNLFE
ncbi:hypothetical protein AAG906_000171 [Vitis piasezkii]